MTLLNIVLFGVLCGSAFATITFRICEGHSRNICKVKGVHITPCEGVHKCFLQKGQNISITVEIAPNFTARSLKTGVYWNSGTQFWPLKVLDSDDVCSHTSCPIKAGKTHTLTYRSIGNLIEVMPQSTYNIRWKAWNEENESQACCFDTSVKKNRRNVVLRMKKEATPAEYSRLRKV